MKRKYFYIGAIVLVLGLTSCSKDFLIQTPTDVIAAEDLATAVDKDPDLLNGNIAGLYKTMINTGSGGVGGHDDFGQKGYDIYTDMLCGDMALLGVNYGWYSGVVRFTATVDFTNNVNYMPWRYYYRLIFAANTVIDALGGNEAELTEGRSRHIMAQAKAVRAYAYFYLANLYSTEGYGTGQEKILPIYVTTAVPNQAMSTAAQVYDLIVSDLLEAISFLDDFKRSTKDQIDKYVAKGLLAYVLASRGATSDLEQVVILTDDVFNNSGASMTTRDQAVARLDGSVLLNPESGFNDVATSSWLWGVDLTLDIGLNLASWWGQIDVFTYSYAFAGDRKAIDAGLFASIPQDDIRKGQFAADLTPRNKFFAPARTFGGTRYATMDYVYMRLDEMVLLNAEAKARLNRDGDAVTSLNRLLSLRLDDTSYLAALSGQALKDEIFKQTRIELWGEGKSYLSMKRNKLTIMRGGNHLFFVGVPYAYNKNELTFEIPQQEVLNNPVLYD